MSDDEYNRNSVDAVLARMEERQKANGEKLDTFLTRFEALDSRVSVLEKFKFKLMGAVALATFLGGYVVDWFKGGNK